MAFNINVDGEKVHEVDIDPRLVTGVSLRTSQGEAGIAGSPFSGEGNDYVNLVLIVQQPTALPVVEDDARLKAQEEGPEEVLTYNENAQRMAEEQALNPDGSTAETTNGDSEEEESDSKPAKAVAKK